MAGVEQAAASLIKLIHHGYAEYMEPLSDDAVVEIDGSVQLLEWLQVWESINGPAPGIPEKFSASIENSLEPHVRQAALGGRFMA